MAKAVDSSSAGYLRTGAGPPYDKALEDIFQRAIIGVTGLPGNLVRPRNQPTPPTRPGFDVDWASFSVYVEPTMWNPHKVKLPDDSYVVEGTEILRLTVGFNGPNYQEFERTWRDGIQLGQNRDELEEAKIALIEFADPVVVPVLLKEQWVKAVDIRATFHRWAVRTYPVLHFASADVDIFDEKLHTIVTIDPSSLP